MILCDFYEIMFFGKDRPQSEGSRHAHPGIKSPPAGAAPQVDTSGFTAELLAGGRALLGLHLTTLCPTLGLHGEARGVPQPPPVRGLPYLVHDIRK